jgi:hypothetical protein
MRKRICFIPLIAVLAVGSGFPVSAQVTKPSCGDSSRQCLVSAATAYIDALLSHDGANVPLAPDVRRTENGLVNANGEIEVRASFTETKMVKARRNLRIIVDEPRQEVVAYFLIDVELTGPAQAETKAGDKSYKVAVSVPGGNYTVHEAERFRIAKGLIKEVEIIAHVENGKGGSSGWSE